MRCGGSGGGSGGCAAGSAEAVACTTATASRSRAAVLMAVYSTRLEYRPHCTEGGKGGKHRKPDKHRQPSLIQSCSKEAQK